MPELERQECPLCKGARKRENACGEVFACYLCRGTGLIPPPDRVGPPGREWGLTEEELDKIIKDWVGKNSSINHYFRQGYGKDIAPSILQALLRKVVESGDEPCPHGKMIMDTDQAWVGRRASKRECDTCWQELRKEAGL